MLNSKETIINQRIACIHAQLQACQKRQEDMEKSISKTIDQIFTNQFQGRG
jgi:Fe2+ transport system protein B